jgi:hypothetical protein
MRKAEFTLRSRQSRFVGGCVGGRGTSEAVRRQRPRKRGLGASVFLLFSIGDSFRCVFRGEEDNSKEYAFKAAVEASQLCA